MTMTPCPRCGGILHRGHADDQPIGRTCLNCGWIRYLDCYTGELVDAMNQAHAMPGGVARAVTDVTPEERQAIADGMQTAVDQMGIADLAAIVRDLAASDPCSDDEYDADAGSCVFCGAEPVGIDRSPDGLGGEDGRIPALLDDHNPACMWRRAVEWVERHPTVDRPT